MKKVDISNRKIIFDHFQNFHDPHFSVVIPFDVTNTLKTSKENGVSFFARYLHDVLKALNSVENLRYRIKDGEVYDCEVINASATMPRKGNTFACSYIYFDEDINKFQENIQKEKERIYDTDSLLPEQENLECIHCSALPWFKFTGHKEPHYGAPDSVPKLAFSKTYEENEKMMMNIAISVHHGLADGYHVGEFAKELQKNFDQ